MSQAVTPGAARAWGWVGHLRAGGTTPWAEWSRPGEPEGRFLPGAQQLEVVRRLNLAGAPSRGLVDRALTASAPGRGALDLALTGVDDEASSFGPPPADPATLSAEELLRVASGLLAEDLVSRALPATDPGSSASSFVRPWRRRYRLVGDPVLAETWRAHLRRRGRPPGGTHPVVVVVGTRLDALLIDAWTSRCTDPGAPGWRAWLDAAIGRDRVPPRADLPQLARAWADRVGPGRVRVVATPQRAARLLGVWRLPAPDQPLSADALEVVRRVANPLGLLVPPTARRDLLQRTLRPLLAASPGAGLTVPGEYVDWVQDQAVRMRHDLLEAGYAEPGDADALLPQGSIPGAPAPSEAGALAVALRVLLDCDHQRGVEEAT